MGKIFVEQFKRGENLVIAFYLFVGLGFRCLYIFAVRCFVRFNEMCLAQANGKKSLLPHG